MPRARPGRASTIETASGLKLSLDRGPGGLRAKRTRADGKESSWVVLGASRGEAGILGEGIRQALLRDPTYGPALRPPRRCCDARRAERTSRIDVVDDPRSAVRPRCSSRRPSAGGHIALTGGSTPRRRLRAGGAARARTGRARRCGWATSAACRPTTSSRTTAWRKARCSTARRRPPEVHRIPGERGPHAGADDYERELRDRASASRRPAARPRAARARARRALRSLFPGHATLDVRDRAVVGVDEAGLEPFVPRVVADAARALTPRARSSSS